MLGISIVVCCHNSTKRLRPTLNHLIKQEECDHILWEVIVVDNASTDNTADLALTLLGQFPHIPSRVILEPKLGLVNARAKGFEVAKYEYVSFIDDDNWVSSNWIRNVDEIMGADPGIGACGGRSEVNCEIDPPSWFEEHKEKYAVGEQALVSCDVTWSRGYLWGAGLTVRKSAWDLLISNGFSPLLTGRAGGRLSAGDDSEICLALRLAGWRLWYDERLTFQHYIPVGRLNWDYLKRIVRGFGCSSVLLSPYHLALVKDIETLRGRTGKMWLWKLRSEIENLVKLEQKRLLKHFSEYDDQELERQRLIGNIQEMLRLRGMYDAYVHAVYNAKWNVIRAQQVDRARRELP